MIYNYLYSFKRIDYIILLLFFLHTAPFLRIGISDAFVTLVSSLILTFVYFFESYNKERPLLRIIIILSCLSINYLLNNCGVGALLGCWELFVILMLCPHMKLSECLFKTLFIFCLFILIVYIYWLYTHPILYTYGAEINSNQVGLFAFYMVSFITLFSPNYKKRSVVFLLLIQLLTFGFITTSECRSAQLAQLFPIAVLMFMLFSKTVFIEKIIEVIIKIYPFFVWGGIIIALFSIINLDDLENVVGNLSEAIGNKKGATLSLRGDIWKESFDYFCKTPFVGTGTHLHLKSFKILALHSSAMNILVFFGMFVFFIIYSMIYNLLRKISFYLYCDLSVILSFVVFMGVLVTSYVESTLMDYFKFYSFLPLFFAFSRINSIEDDNLYL